MPKVICFEFFSAMPSTINLKCLQLLVGKGKQGFDFTRILATRYDFKNHRSYAPPPKKKLFCDSENN